MTPATQYKEEGHHSDTVVSNHESWIRRHVGLQASIQWPMIWLLPIPGMLLVAAAMHDLFHTLFHPTDQGSISEFITLRVWRMFRRYAPKERLMVGPLNFLIVILFWTASVVIGFAMIYRPFLPNRFIVAPGMDPARIDSMMASLNLSLSSLITVSTGLRTDAAFLQFLMGIEAVLGFAILTASISWLLSVYPVIEHRRSLAHEISLLHYAETTVQPLEQLEDTDLNDLFFAFAAEVSTIRTELSQFPISYYFQESDSKTPLSPALYYLAQVAQDISGTKRSAAISATVLGGAIDDLLEIVEDKYLPTVSPDRWGTLAEFLADHGRKPLQRPEPAKAA